MPKVLNSEKPLEEEANEISAGAGDVDQLNAVRTIVALGEDA